MAHLLFPGRQPVACSGPDRGPVSPGRIRARCGCPRRSGPALGGGGGGTRNLAKKPFQSARPSPPRRAGRRLPPARGALNAKDEADTGTALYRPISPGAHGGGRARNVGAASGHPPARSADPAEVDSQTGSQGNGRAPKAGWTQAGLRRMIGLPVHARVSTHPAPVRAWERANCAKARETAAAWPAGRPMGRTGKRGKDHHRATGETLRRGPLATPRQRQGTACGEDTASRQAAPATCS